MALLPDTGAPSSRVRTPKPRVQVLRVELGRPLPSDARLVPTGTHHLVPIKVGGTNLRHVAATIPPSAKGGIHLQKPIMLTGKLRAATSVGGLAGHRIPAPSATPRLVKGGTGRGLHATDVARLQGRLISSVPGRIGVIPKPP